jgi:hypothetical protein
MNVAVVAYALSSFACRMMMMMMMIRVCENKRKSNKKRLKRLESYKVATFELTYCYCRHPPPHH